MQAALDSLAPDFRAAVVLCDIEGLTYEEIAAILDVPMGTVRSRIHRGRSQLRAALPHLDPARRSHASDRRGRVVNGHLGDRAAAYVDGALGPEETTRAEAHLAACPSCRAKVAEQRRVRDVLRGYVPRRRRADRRPDLFAALASMPSGRARRSLLRRGRSRADPT